MRGLGGTNVVTLFTGWPAMPFQGSGREAFLPLADQDIERRLEIEGRGPSFGTTLDEFLNPDP